MNNMKNEDGVKFVWVMICYKFYKKSRVFFSKNLSINFIKRNKIKILFPKWKEDFFLNKKIIFTY